MREAQLAAIAPLELIAADGTAIVLPAGIHDGHRIILTNGPKMVLLTVHVRQQT